MNGKRVGSRSGRVLVQITVDELFGDETPTMEILNLLTEALAAHIGGIVALQEPITLMLLDNLASKINEANRAALRCIQTIDSGADPEEMTRQYVAWKMKREIARQEPDMDIWMDAIDGLDLSGLDPSDPNPDE